MNDFKKKILEFYELRRGNEDLTESNKRQQEMLAQLQKSNHIELIEVLNRDVQQLILEYNEYPSQIKRRGLIRAIFAYIEGNVFKIKEEVLIEESHKRQPTLDIEEMVLLKEASPYINNKGKVKSTVKYSELSANIRFTLNCYAKSAQINHTLDLNGQEWECLIESIRVRNRITHPKSALELEISENELVKAFISYLYFKKVIVDFFEVKTLKLKGTTPGQIIF